MGPNSLRFMSYDSWKLDELLIQQFWADCTFLYKSGFWQNFAMTSQETSYMNNIVIELRFLLVTHTTCFDLWFSRYRILNQVSVLDRFLIDWVYCLVRFLGYKMGEPCWGLNTKCGGNKLRFPTPTQTHVFDNRSNGYSHLSTTHVRSWWVAEKSA
jgi:hypothetical protein